MHSLMNSGPFKYSPATSTVVPARGFMGVWVKDVTALTYTLDIGYRMYVRVRVSGEEEHHGGRR